MMPRFFERVHAAVGSHLVVDPRALEAKLDEVVVGVECWDSGAPGAGVASELLVNQLARLYPNLCLFGQETTVARLAELARAIHPGIRILDDANASTVDVRVSSSLPRKNVETLRVATRGWSAFVGGTPGGETDEAPNVLAAAAAAAIAVGAVFRRLLCDDRTAFDASHVDILGFRGERIAEAPPLGAVDLGNVLVAGAGAVGGAALWTLARVPGLSGRLTIAEPERIELSNLQRYILAMDADEGVAKTQLAARALRGTSLNVHTEPHRLEQCEFDVLPERIMITVDNIAGRRVAQALLPREVFNGWTSATGLGTSWHNFGETQACLACMYHPSRGAPSQIDLVARALGLPVARAGVLWVSAETINAQDVSLMSVHFHTSKAELTPWIGRRLQEVYTQLVCGSGVVSLRPGDRPEAVPLVHQSVLAGVLVAADLVKRSHPRWSGWLPSENSAAWHDVTRPPPSRWLQVRSRVDGCICGDHDYRRVYQEKWLHQSS